MGHTLVIAEPGCTHEGDYDAICHLIETAAACGADVFKNQWTSDPAAMVANRKRLKLKAPKGTQWDDYQQYYAWLAYPVEWHERFEALCESVGMRYACSTYLAKDVAAVAPYVWAFKVSSYEAMDVALLEAYRPFRARRLWVSLGQARGREMEWRQIIGSSTRQWERVRYFHCVSAYPAPLDTLRLRSSIVEGDGFSDHSRSLIAGALAVAYGARYVETHMRLDSCDPRNPDYAVAFDPAEFATYIRYVRGAEAMR